MDGRGSTASAETVSIKLEVSPRPVQIVFQPTAHSRSTEGLLKGLKSRGQEDEARSSSSDDQSAEANAASRYGSSRYERFIVRVTRDIETCTASMDETKRKEENKNAPKQVVRLISSLLLRARLESRLESLGSRVGNSVGVLARVRVMATSK